MFDSVLNRLLHYSWDLAYGIYDETTVYSSFEKLKLQYIKNPYKNKWFADPFILESDKGTLSLLVEEFDYNINRGRLARLKIDKSTNCIVECKIILDLPTHLSFPAIYRCDGKIYVHPENYHSGSSVMYEYNIENDSLINPVILAREPLTDAVIRCQGSDYILYSTKDPTANGSNLHIFKSDNLQGPYTQESTIRFKSNIARMAGQFVTVGGRLVRPAQDCNGAYGRAVLFMENDIVINELRPNSIKYAGVHTFNVHNQEFVIDLKKYDYPLFYYIKEKIKSLFK